MSSFPKELLDIIMCPVTKTQLIYSSDTHELISKEAGLAFPIRDGIPILLVDQARPLDNGNESHE